MIYLLIFYWIFAALFCFGATYAIAKVEGRNIFGVFLSFNVDLNKLIEGFKNAVEKE